MLNLNFLKQNKEPEKIAPKSGVEKMYGDVEIINDAFTMQELGPVLSSKVSSDGWEGAMQFIEKDGLDANTMNVIQGLKEQGHDIRIGLPVEDDPERKVRVILYK